MSWIELNSVKDVEHLNDLFGCFHDSYLKEMCFSSGCYIDEDLSMHEYNNPIARFLFQRQWSNPSVIEIEFRDVLQINKKPAKENEFSDIICSHIYLEDGIFFWNSSDYEIHDDGKDDYTWISAKKVCWRISDELLGSMNIYMKE